MGRKPRSWLIPLGVTGCWLGVSSFGCAAQTVSPDVLVTSDGVGPVGLAMSEADLVAEFGSALVERSEIPLGEGYCGPGTRVFPDTPREIRILWSDSTYLRIAEISFRADGAPWRTPQGVGLGTTLKELEALAGGPVDFLGFEWDYGGTSRWTEEGVASLRLGLVRTAESDAEASEHPKYLEIIGDRTVSSDHPVARLLTIYVAQVSLSGPAQSKVQYLCT